MIFHTQDLAGVFLIEPQPFADERGVFRRHFCQKEFSAQGMDAAVAQCNVSENKFRGTLRGFHYQIAPYGEGKTLSCLKGAIYDMVVDLRPQSQTFLKWKSFTLSAQNRLSVHVPPGCANAFFTLEDDSLIHYYCSHAYVPGAERGIRWNDPIFGFTWPSDPAVISDKDRNWPDFSPDRS